MKTFIYSFILILTIGMLMTAQTYGQGCSFIENPVQHGFNGETFGVKLGDVDSDGDLDAVVVDAYDAVEVWFNDGNGNFIDSAFYLSSNDFYGVELEDIDSDGDLDIIAMAFGWSSSTEIFMNNGAGIFTSTYSLSTDDTEESKLADLDGDGDLDLFYTGSTPEIWLNSGSGYFTSGGTISIMGGDMSDVALKDFDGDGDIDAFFSNDNGSNEIWFNNGNAGFSYGNSYAQGSNSFTGVAADDFDNDGDMDVVFSGQSQNAEVWLNSGNGAFTFGSYLSSSNYDKSVVVDDFDQDGNVDIFISTYGSSGLEVWKNNGNASFTLFYQNTGTSVYGHDFDVGDLDGDGFSDVYVGNFSSSSGDVVFFQESPNVIKNYQYVLCGGGIITVNGQTYDSTGTYTQQYACDSLINIDLTVIELDTSVVINGCMISALDSSLNYQWLNCDDNYSVISGANSQSYMAPTTGYYALEVSDSICVDTSSCHYVEYNPQIVDYQFTICGGDSIEVNSQVYSTPGSYTQTYGCDSLVNIDLTVIYPDTSVVQNGLTLTAVASNLGYQWVNCDNNYSIISGATNKSFTPTTDGNYAVIVTDSFCTDTSSCYNVTGTGVAQHTQNDIKVYPNPANNTLIIEIYDSGCYDEAGIYDITGSEIIRRNEIQKKMVFDVSHLKSGIYLVKLKGNRNRIIRKLIIDN